MGKIYKILFLLTQFIYSATFETIKIQTNLNGSDIVVPKNQFPEENVLVQGNWPRPISQNEKIKMMNFRRKNPYLQCFPTENNGETKIFLFPNNSLNHFKEKFTEYNYKDEQGNLITLDNIKWGDISVDFLTIQTFISFDFQEKPEEENIQEIISKKTRILWFRKPILQ